MGVEAERIEGVVIAKVSGRVDSANSREWHSDLRDAVDETDTALIIDFERLTYISSAGMRVVLMIGKSLRQNGTKLAICSMIDSIRQVFRISGFDKIIQIYETQSEAHSAVSTR